MPLVVAVEPCDRRGRTASPAAARSPRASVGGCSFRSPYAMPQWSDRRAPRSRGRRSTTPLRHPRAGGHRLGGWFLSETEVSGQPPTQRARRRLQSCQLGRRPPGPGSASARSRVYRLETSGVLLSSSSRVAARARVSRLLTATPPLERGGRGWYDSAARALLRCSCPRPHAGAERGRDVSDGHVVDEPAGRPPVPGAGGARSGPPTSTCSPPGLLCLRRLPPAGQPRQCPDPRPQPAPELRDGEVGAGTAHPQVGPLEVRRPHASVGRPRASPPGRRPRRGVPRRGHGPARPIAGRPRRCRTPRSCPGRTVAAAQLWPPLTLRPEHLPHDHYLARDLVQDHPRKIFVRGQGSLCADRHGAPGARRPGRHAGDEQQLATPSPCAAWTVKDDAAPT